MTTAVSNSNKGKRLTVLLKNTSLVDVAAKLDAAIGEENVNEIKSILKNNAVDGKLLKSMIGTVIEEGSEKIDAQILSLLIKANSVTANDLFDYLGRACTHGPSIMVKTLIDCGANPVHASDETYCLSMAINESHVDIVQELLAVQWLFIFVPIFITDTNVFMRIYFYMISVVYIA